MATTLKTREKTVGRKRAQLKPKTYSQKVAARMAVLREERGWTRDDAATHLKLTFEAYSKYENGTRKLSLDLLPKVAKGFGLTVAEFLPEK